MMVVHVGRHGAVQDAAFRAVRFMVDEVGTEPAGLDVWLSPAAGKTHYPLEDFGGVGLCEVVCEQLVRAGVEASQIRLSEADTAIDGRYFSHSQGDKFERFAIVGVIDGLGTTR
jgi:copper oxidase (laccase) domain-containing protein